MEIQFYLEQLQNFARAGVIRVKGEGAFRTRTPIFIPILHPAFIHVKGYPEFIRYLVDDLNIGIMMLPCIEPANEVLEKAKNVGIPIDRIIFFSEKDENNKKNVHHPQDVRQVHFANQIIPHASPRSKIGERSIISFTSRLESLLQTTRGGLVIPVPSDLPLLLDNAKEVINEQAWGCILDKINPLERHEETTIASLNMLFNKCRLDAIRIARYSIPVAAFSHIVNAGFDAIIEHDLLAATAVGKYSTFLELLDVLDLQELPCPCQYCRALSKVGFEKIDSQEAILNLYCHNIITALNEMSRIRYLLRRGGFRDHLESISHYSPATSIFLNKIDSISSKLSPSHVSLVAKHHVNFIGVESYNRPEVIKFRQKVLSNFHFPTRTRHVVLLPCSAGKPYSTSRSHARFATAMRKGWPRWEWVCSELVITSPIGIVPRQLERCFPAAHYDVPVTGYWDERELAFSKNMLLNIIDRHLSAHPGSISKVIAHLDGGYLAACKLAEAELPVPVVYTGDFESSTSKIALDGLTETMRSLNERAIEHPKKDRDIQSSNPRVEDARVLVDFQFETNLGPWLVPDNTSFRRVHGDQYLAMDPNVKKPIYREDSTSGFVILENRGLTMAWEASKEQEHVHLKKIEFDGTKLQGSSVFSPGLLVVDDSISIGDDVFIHDREDTLLGYGRAIVPGPRMQEMKHGPVLDIIRKVQR